MVWMWLTAQALEPVRTELPAGCVTEASDLPAAADFDPKDTGPWAHAGVIAVRKGVRKIMLFEQGKLATLDDGSPACWSVGLGAGYPAGHKQMQGDMKTPEGWYATSDRPWSAFYHAITIHYPDTDDARAGLEKGFISQTQSRKITEATKAGTLPLMTTKLGGQILIHGGGGSSDWTLGCIAMDDAHIDQLRAGLPKGMKTQVLVLP